MTKLWFKAKRYGWGWTPCTWQGWLVIVAYATVVTASILLIPLTGEQPRWTELTIAVAVVLETAILCGIAWKTDETPRWRCGNK